MHFYKRKMVLVTGASSGIGAAFSRLLASYGASLIITARREDRLAELAEELETAYDTEVTSIPCDLSKPDGARNLCEELRKRNISVDVLINNAGFGFNGRFDEGTLETYEQMMQVNMNALVSLTRQLLPSMIARNSGGILNVASIAGFLPIPNFAIYSATKQFVINFSWSLWYELKKSNVRVSVLCPGPVDTEFQEVAGVASWSAALRGLQPAEDAARRGLKGLAGNEGLTFAKPILRIPYLISKWIPVKIGLLAGNLAMKK